MSKKQTATEVANTAVETEKQEHSEELRKQLEQEQQAKDAIKACYVAANRDYGWICRYLDERTAIRLEDIRNLITAISSVRDRNVIGSILNSLHLLLDEVETDIELIIEDGIDELIYRYHESENTICRGGADE